MSNSRILPTLHQAAPEFSLFDQNGKTVALSDLRGKTVVLYFYPKAMTPGCTVQACGLRDSQAAYAAENIAVLGISPDSVARLKKFEAKENINFTLLSDPEHVVAEQYGVWGLKKFMGREFDGIHRTTFVINPEGILVHIMAKVTTKSHDQDVLKWILAQK
ncbi:MAG: thioredoxin-dependent thiol peroxidase [Candidatus Sericytochromatia bacterium]|nr:thioredoxin-dependent thiol peroxidase [Candidatus Sericytochromatia bacterium]